MKRLKDLEEKLGFQFKKPDLLNRAMIHRSYLNEAADPQLRSNERLEFLGDAILSLVISEWLFEDYPHYPEGKLTNFRSNIVRTSALAKIAQELGVGKYLKMSKGEKESNGHKNPTILANTVEAIIGALYLDQGMKGAKSFIRKRFSPLIKAAIEKGELKDAKSLLQEKLQAELKEAPNYKTIKEEGPDHDKTFTVAVYAQKKLLAQAQGKSKQEAEEKAAEEALKKS